MYVYTYICICMSILLAGKKRKMSGLKHERINDDGSKFACRSHHHSDSKQKNVGAAFVCGSLSTKEPFIIGLFCGK